MAASSTAAARKPTTWSWTTSDPSTTSTEFQIPSPNKHIRTIANSSDSRKSEATSRKRPSKSPTSLTGTQSTLIEEGALTSSFTIPPPISTPAGKWPTATTETQSASFTREEAPCSQSKGTKILKYNSPGTDMRKPQIDKFKSLTGTVLGVRRQSWQATWKPIK